MPIFNADTQSRRTLIERVASNRIKAPVVQANVSTLGGVSRASVMVVGSLDPRSKWSNGILQNSRYFMVRIDRDGTVEMFSHGLNRQHRMRRKTVSSLSAAVAYINAWINKYR